MTLICGIPNAGKTTYSQQYENVVHLDEVVATRRKTSPTVYEIVANSNEDVCVEGVFPNSSRRKKLVDACKPEWKKTCIWLNTPLDECLRRENRGRKPALMRLSYQAFEPPTYSEGWDEIIIIGEHNGEPN